MPNLQTAATVCWLVSRPAPVSQTSPHSSADPSTQILSIRLRLPSGFSYMSRARSDTQKATRVLQRAASPDRGQDGVPTSCAAPPRGPRSTGPAPGLPPAASAAPRSRPRPGPGAPPGGGPRPAACPGLAVPGRPGGVRCWVKGSPAPRGASQSHYSATATQLLTYTVHCCAQRELLELARAPTEHALTPVSALGCPRQEASLHKTG